jgi:hypothetical protein
VSNRAGENISGFASRSRRLFLLVLFVAIILIVALLMLERGPSPVSSLGRAISANQPAPPGRGAVFSDVTTTTDNSNAHCKPKQDNNPPNCRPPSGS